MKSSKQAEASTMMRGRSTKHDFNGSQTHGRSKSQSKKHLKCYYCGKREHANENCWHRKNRGKNFEPSTSQDCVANTSEDRYILVSESSN